MPPAQHTASSHRDGTSIISRVSCHRTADSFADEVERSADHFGVDVSDVKGHQANAAQHDAVHDDIGNNHEGNVGKPKRVAAAKLIDQHKAEQAAKDNDDKQADVAGQFQWQQGEGHEAVEGQADEPAIAVAGGAACRPERSAID